MKKLLAVLVSLAVIMVSFPLAVLADSTVDVGSWDELKAAIENAGDGGSATISLTADCSSSNDEADELLIHDNRNITILLNGHNLSRRAPGFCEWGRVIDIHSGSSLTLIGDPVSRGSILGGQCTKDGGGISNYGTLTLQDCIIDSNYTRGNGGGVYCAPGSNINVQGYVNISGNSSKDGDNSVDNNLYLDGWVSITVTGTLDPTSVIKVSGSNLERFITYNWSNSGITDQDTIGNLVKYDDGNRTALYGSGELGLKVYYMHRWVDENDQVQEEMVLPDSVPHRITETSTELAPGWYYVEGEVNIDEYIALEGSGGDYHLILTDDSVLNINSLRHYHSSCLYIHSQSGYENRTDSACHAGRLNASGSEHLAGIGGGDDLECGSIEIQGGIITATGGEDQPGIGGKSLTGSIRILGGDIIATGGENAAGIGGSNNIDIESGTISIYAGKVEAHGGGWGAGIGTGNNGDFEFTVNIYGGDIAAYGGNGGDPMDGSGGGAGIGAGYEADMAGSINITGGNIYAQGQDGGACIGAGCASEQDHWDGDWRGPISITGGAIHLHVGSTNGHWGSFIGRGEDGGTVEGEASLTLSDDRSVVYDEYKYHASHFIRVSAEDREETCYYIPSSDPLPEWPKYQDVYISECPHEDMTYPLDQATEDYHRGNCEYCYTHPTGPHAFENGECIVCHYPQPTYSVTVNNGSSDVSAAFEGATVTITASPGPAGQAFDHWEVEPGTVVLADATSAVTTFTMPDEAVEVTAVYRDTIYNITVNNGSSNVATAVHGTTVTITADPPPAGRVFDHWEIEPGAIALADATSAVTTFTMPTEDVAVTATYRDITYNVTVNNGSSNVRTAAHGATVTITADPAPAGRVFDHWEIEPGAITLADATSAVTTFTMPTEDVAVTAIYRDSVYNITVNYGSSNVTTAVHGTTVTITAVPAPAGRVFDHWEIEPGAIALADATSAVTTFTMPTEDVVVTATYRDIVYNITVNYGSSNVAQAAHGATVTITADPASAGRVFDHWEIVPGVIVLADATSATTTFTMPGENVVVTAAYRDADATTTTHTVTFESNGGSAVAVQTVADGSKVVKPADPTREGFVFDGWCPDAACTAVFDFDTAITADVTLYARWVPASGGVVPSTGEERSKFPIVCFLLACASFAVAVYLRRDERGEESK